MMEFSVLVSVYKNDKAEDFRTALESVTFEQTLMPTEVVLVVDGPVPDGTNRVITDFEAAFPRQLKVIRFEQNQGLGIALQQGMLATSNEIVMRMDSDDIAAPDRFKKQCQFMESHPDVAICGGQIVEFIDGVGDVGKRTVPCTDSEIRKYMKSRCPFNHMTVALRRSKVLEAGNYQAWFWNEDYYLWIRMMLAGQEFANLPDTLVHVRVGRDMYMRRGGKKYFRSEVDIQKLLRRNGLISWPRYCFNVAVRWGVQVAMPNGLRSFIFQKVFR